jgi:hypothetical protein
VLLRWSLALSLGLGLVAACATAVDAPSGAGGGGAGGEGGDPTTVGPGGAGGAGGCECAPGPHNGLVYLLSDDREIWSFDPATNEVSYVRTLLCEGAETPFSMAVDRNGTAWVLEAETALVFQVDLGEAQGCTVAPYTPHQASFDLFGMAIARPAPGACEQLYVHSYSGDGPFTEGPDLGSLGVVDDEGTLTILGSVDYDGGELTGTGNGRLFAFAGVDPAKIVEYDPSDGSLVETYPLPGLSKTSASAFAFFEGDFYVFTEAPPEGCTECLETACGADLDACVADPPCNGALECVLAGGDISSDDCGGPLSNAMTMCFGDCSRECLQPASARVSQVTRVDFDGSDGPPLGREVVVAETPIRIVGAGVSTCVPLVPR